MIQIRHNVLPEITVKVLVVDQQPVQIRADLDWTVERLKREIGKVTLYM